jgi:predicted enzyme related to lactoylglutathione lyase
VTYVELNSPDLEATTAFMRDVFGWEAPIIASTRAHGSSSRSLPGVGRGCYLTDPPGLLIGLHEYGLNAR